MSLPSSHLKRRIALFLPVLGSFSQIIIASAENRDRKKCSRQFCRCSFPPPAPAGAPPSTWMDKDQEWCRIPVEQHLNTTLPEGEKPCVFAATSDAIHRVTGVATCWLVSGRGVGEQLRVLEGDPKVRCAAPEIFGDAVADVEQLEQNGEEGADDGEEGADPSDPDLAGECPLTRPELVEKALFAMTKGSPSASGGQNVGREMAAKKFYNFLKNIGYTKRHLLFFGLPKEANAFGLAAIRYQLTSPIIAHSGDLADAVRFFAVSEAISCEKLGHMLEKYSNRNGSDSIMSESEETGIHSPLLKALVKDFNLVHRVGGSSPSSICYNPLQIWPSEDAFFVTDNSHFARRNDGIMQLELIYY